MALDQADLDNINGLIQVSVNSALSQIMIRLGDISSQIGSVVGSVNGNTGTLVSGLHDHLSTVQSDLSIDFDIPNLFSLNGNGCEYADGTIVSVYDRVDAFTVKRSYMGLQDANSYTVVYDLESDTGLKVVAPEALLTLYVPVVENSTPVSQ